MLTLYYYICVSRPHLTSPKSTRRPPEVTYPNNLDRRSLCFIQFFVSHSSSETQGFNGDGKGRERLGAGKKEGGGEGKGKGKGKGTFPFPSPPLLSPFFSRSQSLPSLPIPFEALGFRGCIALHSLLGQS